MRTRETRIPGAGHKHRFRQRRADDEFQPGGSNPQTNYVNQSEERAYDLSQGQQLYEKFNCVGCHAHGGGDKGPALTDDKWIYGYRSEQIYASIVQGRPNGMPSFGGKIPESEVWKIVAYVRSLSGLTSKSVAPAREDHMSGPKPPNSLSKPNPKAIDRTVRRNRER
jgi:cytochrome c oxidase cbb3-type subunit 3